MNEQVNLAITLESLQATARMKAFSAEVQKGTQLVNKMGQPLGDLSKSVKAASTSFFSLRSAISAAFGGSVLLLMFRGVRAMGEWAKAAGEQDKKIQALSKAMNMSYKTALEQVRKETRDSEGAISDLTTAIGYMISGALTPLNNALSGTAEGLADVATNARLARKQMEDFGGGQPEKGISLMSWSRGLLVEPGSSEPLEGVARSSAKSREYAAGMEAYRKKNPQYINLLAEDRAKNPMLQSFRGLQTMDEQFKNTMQSWLRPAEAVLEKMRQIRTLYTQPLLGMQIETKDFPKFITDPDSVVFDKFEELPTKTLPGIALETRKVGDEWEAVGMRMEQAFVGAAYGSGNFFQNVVAGFRNMLQQMAALLAAKAAVFAFLNMVTGGSFSIAQGGLGGFLGGLKGIMGFAQGGWTGELGGLVHQHEYVVPEWLTKKAPGTIAALENARRGGNGGNVNMTFNVSGNNRELETLFRDRLVPMIRNAKRSGLLESV